MDSSLLWLHIEYTHIDSETSARLPHHQHQSRAAQHRIRIFRITPDDIKVSGMLIEINQVAEEDLFMRKFHRTYKFCEFLIRKGSNEIMYGNFVS